MAVRTQQSSVGVADATVLTDVVSSSLPSRVGQATCSCKPGLVSTNHNASAGCFAYCFPYSCDRSATCQVTPDGKTR